LILNRYTAFIVLLLTIPFADLLGQSSTSLGGRFEADFVKGCAPLTININEIDGLDPDLTRVYDYEYVAGGPVDPVNLTTHTYTTPGEYMILQVIQNITPRTDTLYVEVLEPLQPEFTISNCEANGIFIDITDGYYDRFVIDYGDGSGQDTVTATTLSHIFAGQGIYDITVQGLFDDAATNCGVGTQTITTINSLQAGQLDRVEVLDASSIEVGFSNLNPNIQYRLEVAQNGATNFVEETLLDHTTANYTVSGLDTRNNYYCFRITAVNPCDERRNLSSGTICSLILNVTAENQQNQLDWITNNGNIATYAVNKNGNLLTNITNPNTISLTDPDVVCQETYLYQLTATASAGGVSISEAQSVTALSTDISPPIVAPAISVSGAALALTWADSVADLYYIQRAEAGGGFVKIDSVTTNTYTDNQVNPDVEYCYIITYQDACGNESEDSEPQCLEVPSQVTIYFPTAFTPNGDGLNDVFMGKSDLVNTVEIKIFNRWGELIFISNSLDEGWNGIFRGQTAQEGTYVYRAEFTDHLNNQLSQFGSFLLLRK
jgi:gliding motility-associated-like protein